jgi:hypothetical protein
MDLQHLYMQQLLHVFLRFQRAGLEVLSLAQMLTQTLRLAGNGMFLTRILQVLQVQQEQVLSRGL